MNSVFSSNFFSSNFVRNGIYLSLEYFLFLLFALFYFGFLQTFTHSTTNDKVPIVSRKYTRVSRQRQESRAVYTVHTQKMRKKTELCDRHMADRRNECNLHTPRNNISIFSVCWRCVSVFARANKVKWIFFRLFFQFLLFVSIYCQQYQLIEWYCSHQHRPDMTGKIHKHARTDDTNWNSLLFFSFDEFTNFSLSSPGFAE